MKLRPKLPPHLSTVERISDLMATPEGSDWWKKHGQTVDMTFDLTPGSKSLETWETYRRVKAQQKPPKAE
jgi:hypothetical protein